MQVRFGALALFVDHRATPEAVEAELRRLPVRLVARQKMGKDQPEAGVALKPP